MRRGIEELPPATYDALTYYERWIASIANILVQKGVLSPAEIEQRMAALKAKRADEAA